MCNPIFDNPSFKLIISGANSFTFLSAGMLIPEILVPFGAFLNLIAASFLSEVINIELHSFCMTHSNCLYEVNSQIDCSAIIAINPVKTNILICLDFIDDYLFFAGYLSRVKVSSRWIGNKARMKQEISGNSVSSALTCEISSYTSLT